MAPRQRNRFPRSARVRAKQEFQHALREGVRASDGLMTLYASFNACEVSRLGISIGRRAGNAVRRNRIKRLLRDVFRLCRHELRTGIDWIAIPRPCTADTRAEWEASFRNLVNKLGRDLDRMGAKRKHQVP